MRSSLFSADLKHILKDLDFHEKVQVSAPTATFPFISQSFLDFLELHEIKVTRIGAFRNVIADFDICIDILELIKLKAIFKGYVLVPKHNQKKTYFFSKNPEYFD